MSAREMLIEMNCCYMETQNGIWIDENVENTRAYRWVNIPAGVFVNLNKDTCLLLELGGFYTYNITSKTKMNIN